jgi:Family of unknown function (DUF6328)
MSYVGRIQKKNGPLSVSHKKVVTREEAVTHLLEECRMGLPGIQALFGFQLIAVFNPRFAEQLTKREPIAHYLAIAFVAAAVRLVMTPAALHRQNGGRQVSDDFLIIASHRLLLSMFPLMFGICLDFYLIGRLVLQNTVLRATFAVMLLGVFSTLWFLLPRSSFLLKWARLKP